MTNFNEDRDQFYLETEGCTFEEYRYREENHPLAYSEEMEVGPLFGFKNSNSRDEYYLLTEGCSFEEFYKREENQSIEFLV